MAGRGCEVTDVRELLRRLRLGEPDRRVARELRVGRNTVARYRRLPAEQGFLAGELPDAGTLGLLLAPARITLFLSIVTRTYSRGLVTLSDLTKKLDRILTLSYRTATQGSRRGILIAGGS